MRTSSGNLLLPKPSVVLDASVIVSAALRRGSIPDRALEIGLASCRLVLSVAVEAELRDVLSRPKFSRALAPGRGQTPLAVLALTALRVEPAECVHECRDPDDDKYLEPAFAASAAVIVSGDRDLLALDPWRGVRILSPAAFVALWDDPAP